MTKQLTPRQNLVKLSVNLILHLWDKDGYTSQQRERFGKRAVEKVLLSVLRSLSYDNDATAEYAYYNGLSEASHTRLINEIRREALDEMKIKRSLDYNARYSNKYNEYVAGSNWHKTAILRWCVAQMTTERRNRFLSEFIDYSENGEVFINLSAGTNGQLTLEVVGFRLDEIRQYEKNGNEFKVYPSDTGKRWIYNTLPYNVWNKIIQNTKAV